MDSNYEQSIAKYQQFLGANGYSPKLVWVTSDDVLVSNEPIIYVKVPVSRENEQSVRKLLDLGIDQKKGVLLDTLCYNQDATFCYAWVPRDPLEAEQALMPSGLKMSVSTVDSRIVGKPVQSLIHWIYLRIRYRKEQQRKHLLFQPI